MTHKQLRALAWALFTTGVLCCPEGSTEGAVSCADYMMLHFDARFGETQSERIAAQKAIERGTKVQ